MLEKRDRSLKLEQLICQADYREADNSAKLGMMEFYPCVLEGSDATAEFFSA